MSALADIFKMMDIPDILLSQPQKIDKSHTFTRLLACLEKRLDPSDYQAVERAVRLLRTINDIRTGLQHSGMARSLPTALETLGIPYPLRGWGDAWNNIRSVTIDALRIIREKVIRYATATTGTE
jgi:hypothetical protein